MSKYRELAQTLRDDPDVHYSCSRAVLMAFCEEAGMSREMAWRVAANFNAGMRTGSVCGAMTGGLMVLGLFGLDDQASVTGFLNRMKAGHDGMSDCVDLLRVNAQRGGQKKPHCDAMVYEAVGILEEMLRDAGKIE